MISRTTAPDVVFAASSSRITVAAGGDAATAGAEVVTVEDTKILGLDPALSKAIVACDARREEIETFDIDPATGATRKLHAFVLEPVQPVADEERLVMVRSFYGGGNVYNVYDNICLLYTSDAADE